MVYLNNKNLKNTRWSLDLNTAFSLLYFGKFSSFLLLLFDTNFTLNLRGRGRWCVCLFSSGPVRFSSNYLTMPFLAGLQSNVSKGVLFI